MNRLAPDQNFAPVRPVHARENLHQRGLARPVLADERVHLARRRAQRDARKHAVARERLGDAAHLQRGRSKGHSPRKFNRDGPDVRDKAISKLKSQILNLLPCLSCPSLLIHSCAAKPQGTLSSCCISGVSRFSLVRSLTPVSTTRGGVWPSSLATNALTAS